MLNLSYCIEGKVQLGQALAGQSDGAVNCSQAVVTQVEAGEGWPAEAYSNIILYQTGEVLDRMHSVAKQKL